MIRLSEQVRRLEDSIENLRAENKKLRNGVEPSLDERDEIIDHQNWEISKLKEQIKKLTELNEQLTNTSNDGTKLIGQLKSELLARVKQVEDLQSSYKTLQKENERLNSKLEQTVDEYDEDYQTFHNNRKYTEKRGEEELHPYGRSIADYIEDDDMREIFKKFLGHDPF